MYWRYFMLEALNMQPGEPPTQEELEFMRQKLSREIEEAQQLFPTEKNARELLTSKAALKCIEQMILIEKRRHKRDVA